MSRKVQLRLLASKEMSERGEHSRIRFPLRARENFGFVNDQIVVGKGDLEIALIPRKAFKPDVQRLATMLRRGQITEQEALSVGFVTRSVQQRVNARDGRSAWVSEGVGSITIGADPEFGLLHRETGVLCRGTKVLPRSRHAEFGADGPGVEVRPQPSRNHLTVVKNMRAILQNPPQATEGYAWRGGATYEDANRTYWFGGHVHLGRPQTIGIDEAFPCYERIAIVLDHLLALPMVKFDTPNPHKRRLGCPAPLHYGMAGDIRADYPEQDRFEYRVLSGLWLTHPDLSRIVLGTSKCVAETAYNRIADKKYDYTWVEESHTRKNSFLGSFGIDKIRNVSSIINHAVPDKVTEDHIREWESRIRSLDSFDTYSKELEALISLAWADPSEVVPQLSLDLREGWWENRALLPKTSNKKLKASLEALEE